MLLLRSFLGHSPSHGLRRDSPLRDGANSECTDDNSSINWNLHKKRPAAQMDSRGDF
jgi:hypothetical protein